MRAVSSSSSLTKAFAEAVLASHAGRMAPDRRRAVTGSATATLGTRGVTHSASPKPRRAVAPSSSSRTQSPGIGAAMSRVVSATPSPGGPASSGTRRVRRNTQTLALERVQAASATASAAASSSHHSARVTKTRCTSPDSIASASSATSSVKPPKIKPAKTSSGAGTKGSFAASGKAVWSEEPSHVSIVQPGMRRVRSAVSLSSKRDMIDATLLTPEVKSALDAGLVQNDDINVYGMRTHWQGFRHEDLNALLRPTPLSAPSQASQASPSSPPDDTSSSSSTVTKPFATPAHLQRRVTCPRPFGQDAPTLVKAEYTFRNHRLFTDVYDDPSEMPLLGTGGYAVVKQCTNRVTGKRYAAKMMVVAKGNETAGREVDKQALLNEIELMARLDHPNIVNVVEYFLQTNPDQPHCNTCVIVMDLLEGPDMMDYIRDEDKAFSAKDTWTIMRSLFDAVAHIHHHGISHRDLKLENLVFGKAGDLRTLTIVDFGLAKAVKARERMEGVLGTLWYTAPEVLRGRSYTASVDMWALGVIMYLLLTGNYPFDVDKDTLEPDTDEEDWMEDYEEGEEEEALAEWRTTKQEELLEDLIIDTEPSYDHPAFHDDPIALDLVRGLLEKDPARRMSSAAALEHRWLTGHVYHDAEALMHVHTRISALRATRDLPIRRFEPGDWIVQRGHRASAAREVFLIVSGEAEVLLYHPSSPEADPATGLVRLCVRHPGNFVGALTLQCARHGRPYSHSMRSSSEASSRSDGDRAGRIMHAATGSGGLDAAIVQSCAAAETRSASITVPGTACSACLTSGCAGKCGCAAPSGSWVKSSSPGSAETHSGPLAALSASWRRNGASMHASKSLGGSCDVARMCSRSSSEHPDETRVQGGEATQRRSVGLMLRTVLMLLCVKHRWLGHRRTLSVRALTPTDVVVLSHEDMQWAVMHDYRTSRELALELDKRKLKVAKAIRAEKRKEKAARDMESKDAVAAEVK